MSKVNKNKPSYNVTQKRRVADRLCTWCEKPLPDGYTVQRCPDCVKYQQEKSRMLKEYRKLHNLCRQCGAPLYDSVFFTCDACRQKHREKDRKYKEKMRHDS